jgi:hypothetical protein
LTNLAAGFAYYFMLALGLNGFMGSDAEYSMNLFPVGVVIVSVLSAVGGIFATGYLIANKNWNPVSAVAVSSIVFIVIGLVVNVVLMFAAIFLADYIRTSRIKQR